MNIEDIAKRLGIAVGPITSKAQELLRIASVKLPSGLGQADLCKPAVCLELACSQMGCSVKREDLVRCSCCTAKMYQTTYLSLQKLLGGSSRADARELVVQHGCMRLEPAVRRVLASYKGRFLEKLPPSQRMNADFSRPVFTAVAFYVVARKNRVRVDRNQLMKLYSISPSDFNNTYTSMYDACFDQVGIEKRKRNASDRQSNAEVLNRHSNPEEGEEDGDDDGAAGEYDEDMPHNSRSQKDKQEFKAWKAIVLSDKPRLDVKRLRQATLPFAPKI